MRVFSAAAKSASLASAQEKSRPKRKTQSSKTMNGEIGSEDETDELDDDQSTQPTKKRRTSKVPGSAGERKLYYLKTVKELETQIARVLQAQANAERDLKRLQDRLSSLSAAIQESDED
jgi:hypothetical protein